MGRQDNGYLFSLGLEPDIFLRIQRQSALWRDFPFIMLTYNFQTILYKYLNLQNMQGTSTQSSFYIRTINPSRTANYEPNKPFVTIEPEKIEILNYMIGVIVSRTITVRNESKLPKKIAVVPPGKSYFSIRCPQKEIRGKDSIQICVLFNPQKERSIIEDELVIKVKGDESEFHVPVYCYPQNILSRPESRKILARRDSEDNHQLFMRRESIRPKKMNKRSSISLIGALLVQNIFGNQVYSANRANFEQKFRMISEYVREKLVKNEVYLGAKAISRQKQQQIEQFKLEIAKNERDRLMNEVTNRFVVNYANEGPIVSNEVQINLSWNTQKNIPNITFNLGVQKVREEVRKYVVTLRFQRIKNSLKIFDEYKKKAENQARKIKIEEYVEYLENRLAEKCVASDYEFEFDNISAQPTMLPIQAEFRPIQTTFQISQRVGFDNWVPMTILKPSFQQIYSEQEMDFPLFFYHHPTSINENKKGGIQEMPFKESRQFQVSQLQEFLQVDLQQKDDQLSFVREIIQKKQQVFLQTETTQEEEELPQQQLMSLGPLNPLRCNKRPTTSIDLYSFIKQ